MSKSFNDLRKALSQDKKNLSEFSTELPYLRRKACYRAMKNKELKSFLKALEKRDEYAINESLDKILENCVTTIDGEPFDCDKLCTQDRTYLLIKIKQATRGDIVKFPHVYREDKDPVEVEVDIKDFPVIYKEEKIHEVIDLNDNVRFIIGPVTRGDEKELEHWLKHHASKDSMVDRKYSSYATIIDGVEMLSADDEDSEESWQPVDLSFNEKVKLLEDFCDEMDLEKFDALLDVMDFGIKLKFKLVADDYENEEEEVNLLSFFIV